MMKISDLKLFNRNKKNVSSGNDNNIKINLEGYNEVFLKKLGYLEFKDIQEYILKTICWYNIKFPSCDLKIDNDRVFVKEKPNKNISDYMNVKSFYNRLSSSVIESLKCNYFNNCDCNLYSIDKKEYSDDDYIFIQLLSLDKKFLQRDSSKDCFVVATKDGKVVDFIGNNILLNEIRKTTNRLSLNKLLAILKKSEHNNLDYYNLEKCVMNHKNDVATRFNIVNIIFEKLVSSAKNPEIGYFRAANFLEDFSNSYDLNFANLISVIETNKINNKKINLMLSKK